MPIFEDQYFKDYVNSLPAATENDLAAGNNMPLVSASEVKKMGGENVGKVFSFSLDDYDFTLDGFIVGTNGTSEAPGSLHKTGSSTAYCFYNRNFSIVAANLGFSGAAGYAYAIAFYSSEQPSASSLISGIDCLNSSKHDYTAKVPENCKLIVVTNRASSLASPTASVIGSAATNVKAAENKIENPVADLSERDHYSYGFVNADGSYNPSGAAHLSYFVNRNFSKIRAHLGFTSPDGYAQAIAFYSDYITNADGSISFVKEDFIGGVPSINSAADYTAKVPENCKLIVVGNRDGNLASPTASLFTDIKGVFDFSKSVAGATEEILVASWDEGKFPFLGYVEPSGIVRKTGSTTSKCFPCHGYTKVQATLGFSADVGYCYAIAFYSNYIVRNGVITFDAADLMQDSILNQRGTANYVAQVPVGCKLIVASNRDTSYATPSLSILTNATSTIRSLDFEETSDSMGFYDDKIENLLIQQRFSGIGEGATSGKVVSLLWYSDVHGNADAQAAVDKIATKFSAYIDDVIHTGDGVNNYITQDNVVPSYVLNVIGNHEAYADAAHVWITDPTIYYNKIFKDNVENWGVVQPENAESLGKCYYYKDYTEKSLRLIVLNCFDWDGKFISQPETGNNPQRAWFQAVLADAITNGLAVVVACHYMPDYVWLDDSNGWTAYGESSSGVSSWGVKDDIETFVSNGGEFVCWICGHSHKDRLGTFAQQGKHLCVQVGQQTTARGVDVGRKVGTLSESNFNFITFDTQKKVVKIAKYGCNYDEFLRSRNVFTWDYVNKKIIHAE